MRQASLIKRAQAQEDVLSEKEEPKGLCSCCKIAPTCTYYKTFGYPILECDEFQGLTPAPQEGTDSLRPSAPRVEGVPGPAEQQVQRWRGLCSTCELRETCTYPKPEGGVWHCEEYR